MISKLFRKLVDSSPNFSLKLWQIFYDFIGLKFRNQTNWKYMNYGFSQPENQHETNLDTFSENLYRHLFNQTTLENKDILEIGCGRGGGCELLLNYHPNAVTGLDFSEKGIKFCQNTYRNTPIKFVAGNAEILPFPDRSFDVIVNLESSHCYGNRAAFFSEVFRTLKPNGIFLYADFMGSIHFHKRPVQLENTGFNSVLQEDITANVLLAMERSAPYKKQLIEKLVPWPFRKIINDFVGLPGSDIYTRFKSNQSTYFSIVCRKG